MIVKELAILMCCLYYIAFVTQQNLTLHLATHETKNLNCPECMKKFSRMAGLKAHIRIHEREENLMCTECGDEFTVQVRMEVAEQRSEVTGGRSLSSSWWTEVAEWRSLGWGW